MILERKTVYLGVMAGLLLLAGCVGGIPQYPNVEWLAQQHEDVRVHFLTDEDWPFRQNEYGMTLKANGAYYIYIRMPDRESYRECLDLVIEHEIGHIREIHEGIDTDTNTYAEWDTCAGMSWGKHGDS